MMAKVGSVDEAGFYVEHFSPSEMADLETALGDSLRGEIGMLRVIMRRFFERAADEADDLQALANSLRVLGMSCTRLAKVIQTERSLQDQKTDALGEALSRSMAAVLEEMGHSGLNGKHEGGQLGR